MVNTLNDVVRKNRWSSGKLRAMDNGILLIERCRDAMCELLCKSRSGLAETQLLVTMPRLSHRRRIVSRFILTIN
jgi:hypothetical protein